MDPLVQRKNLTRTGAPKNPILERAEWVADAHLPFLWKLFPFALLILLAAGMVAAWKYYGPQIAALQFPYASLVAYGGIAVISVITCLLLADLVHSYLKILRTNRSLYFQSQMFSLIIEGVNDGIWDWDLETNKIYFSPRWNEMFGYRKAGISEDPNEWFSLIHPEDLPGLKQNLELHFEKKNALFRIEHRIKTVSGDYKWVLDRGHAIWDQHGKVLRMAGSTTDISNTKDVEAVLQGKTEELEREKEAVRREKVKYEALLTSIGDGMIATDHDGQIMVMNPQAAKMLGRDLSASVGRFFTEVVTLEQNEKEEMVAMGERPVIQTLVQGIRVTTVSYFFRSDGTKFPAAVTSAPIVLGDQVIGAIVVFRDITREKEIDKSKTEFVSLASHQLRTPLSAIRWYSEMLKSERLGTLTEQQKSYLDEIYNSNMHMITLVNSLLNTSRIDLGTFAIEPEPTEFKTIAEDVLRELFVKIKENEQHVTASYDENFPKVSADPKLVRIIFQNLLSNAIKYTPKGGNISLSLTKDAKDLLIKVSDTGVGIPEAVQGRIFTKLFRADNARMVESEGTGLGLYIVKAVVEKGGGKIWFESKENQGTTFYVQMPLSGMKAVSGSKDLA